MKKLLLIVVIGVLLVSGCTTSTPTASKSPSYPVCTKVSCVPKPNDPGKPSCSAVQILDYSNTECKKPSAPIVGVWEGYGTTQPLSNARFVFNDDHTLQMTGLPIIGSATANWYRCGDELDCLNSGLNNNNYIILGKIYNNQIINYDGKSNSIEITGNKLIKQ